MNLRWEGTIGPAAIIGVVQVVIWGIGGVVVVERMQDGIDTAKQQIVEVHAAVEELRHANAVIAERVTRNEAQTEFVVRSVDRIEKKMDARPGP